MSRPTIDFGIDLGTTNSSIAVFKDGDVEIFRNNEGFEYTPSVVWLDKHNHLVVGRVAKERSEDDTDNAFSEFKRLMGTAERREFARNGQAMTPEELSAEVLKSLKGDVRQRSDEEVAAAVITVPADFELPQCDATKRAAQLAGLTSSPLLQEPVAAALAYGFQSQSDKVFWMVYDFGGGTFDAAIIQVRDGAIEVVNHGGDNYLGGKDIDWAIVDNLLVPALIKEHSLPNFKRGNKKWRAAFAKLKWHAEEAKIAVSRRKSHDIEIEFTAEDNFPEPVKFEYEIQQSQVASLAAPFVLKTINICRKTMADRRLASGNIEKVILVGGPTLAPYIREQLADSAEGLGIPLETKVDPMTVVARGAAIFAGTQRLQGDEAVLIEKRQEGNFTVSFPDWKFTGSDIEPVVAGMVQAPAGEDPSGLSIEFVNSTAKPAWRSGKLALRDGKFMTTLWAEKGHANTFEVELFDGSGRSKKVVTDPEPLTYTVGLTFTEPPLTHSVGVALANNEFLTLIEKGTPLPAHKRDTGLKTAVEVRQGREGDLIRIPVLEGEDPRADRNRRISTLEIRSHQVKRDVPAGSDIEVTIDIDRDRLVLTRAYIPILDEEYEDVITMKPEEDFMDTAALQADFEREKDRLKKSQEQASASGDERAQEALHKIDDEHMVQEVDSALAAASDDADSAKKARNRLLDLRKAIDSAEVALEWPSLVLDAEKVISGGKEIGQQFGNPDERRILQSEEAQLRIAMGSHDSELLGRRIESYRMAVLRILQRTGVLHVLYFQNLSDRKAEMRDQAKAERLISDGLRAMNANDIDRLQAINRELAELCPTPPPPPDISTVIKKY